MKIKHKIKKLIFQTLAVLNTVEGIVHLIVASIGFWGCFDLKIFDIRVLLPNIENFVFGVFSILTGVLIIKLTDQEKSELGFQDENRTYTNNERQLDTLIDCRIGQREAAMIYQKPMFIKMPRTCY